MARFKYTGRTIQGKREGSINASSKREALFSLREQGIRVTEIMEVKESFFTKDIVIGNPVKLQDMVIYLRQFATLLSAGISIIDSTRILAEQTSSKVLRKVLKAVEEDLREGNPLSNAAEKHRRVFSPMFINMVRAGEASGNMDETLERLAIHYERQHFTKQKIISALAYPAAVGLLSMFVVVFLLIYVVPIFVGMFASLGGKLPFITQFVLDASAFVQSYWWLIAFVVILITIVFILLRNNETSKYYLDYAVLRMPVIGKLLQKAELAKMTRTLSSLFSSSVPILQALTIVESVVENKVIAEVVHKSHAALENGQSLIEPMKKHWAFPPLITQMIAIGEETGSLDLMLGKVADFYEKEVEVSTDRLKAILEPLLIVLLAGLVGVIVSALMIPMFEIFNQVDNY
ncbi:type II secretion system F family protein [Niallia circulans]|uniref:type II secretion system F family protein n=1 Tax=Niallia circulans TaxID=1397 RepID=UPI001F1BE264|nr:type II secretion system F family protein [Niallia circulans]MCF2646718.1 type II secretion system F family protein [Niallia circulans]